MPAMAMDTAGGQTPQPILDVDSLKTLYVESKREAHRIRHLEQQIELLQGELNKCAKKEDK
jgi:hypothetical protein